MLNRLVIFVHKVDDSKNKTMIKQNRNVWEHLYSLNKELIEKRNQSHLEKKLKDAQESLRECTFQPDVEMRSYMTDIMYKKEGNIYERSTQWKQDVEER